MSDLPVELAAIAQLELREADAWWSEHRPENPDGVRHAVARGLALISERPLIGPALAGTPGVRRLPLHGVPYAIFYRVGHARVEVMSVWHARRGTGPRL